MPTLATPIIAVFAGGTSAEREVSLGSGMACAVALARSYSVQFFRIDRDELPEGIDAARHVVFSTLHGTFGEDGGMQQLLDTAGIHYAGCDAASSALTMDKTRTKAAAARHGVGIAPGLAFSVDCKPSADAIISQLGTELVLKPNAEGSSVGLHIISGLAQLQTALLDTSASSEWLVEKRIIGHELAIGVLNGRAMGIVEIRPKSGVYDYASKYTAGLTEYLAPAPLGDALTAKARVAAESMFTACGCRDYARVDFMVSGDGELFLLEINTLPGMKETSLLPKSAGCSGLDFTALVRAMTAPALERFYAAQGTPLTTTP